MDWSAIVAAYVGANVGGIVTILVLRKPIQRWVYHRYGAHGIECTESRWCTAEPGPDTFVSSTGYWKEGT